MPTSSVAKALASVQNRIAIATRQSGRDDTAVQLIAISKTKPPELLRDAVAVGQLVFGENRVQEALEKMEERQACRFSNWEDAALVSLTIMFSLCFVFDTELACV